jgi:hypothetical protein
MTTISRIFTVVFVTLVVGSLGAVPQAQAQQHVRKNGIVGELKTLTAVVFPSGEEVLLSVPVGKNFVLTQACFVSGAGTNYRIHNVAGGGTNSQLTLDNTDCQEYTPGVVFHGGDDVTVRNNSGTETTRVLLNGILTKK